MLKHLSVRLGREGLSRDEEKAFVRNGVFISHASSFPQLVNVHKGGKDRGTAH